MKVILPGEFMIEIDDLNYTLKQIKKAKDKSGNDREYEKNPWVLWFLLPGSREILEGIK